MQPSSSSIEGKLLNCCKEDLKSDILVVGHHGSKTSSRKLFLDAIGAKMFILSSDPQISIPADEFLPLSKDLLKDLFNKDTSFALTRVKFILAQKAIPIGVQTVKGFGIATPFAA